jgi:transposase InsO family protein
LGVGHHLHPHPQRLAACALWVYLSAVLDLHSRKLVGWAMPPTMPADLVCTALQMAICQRAPAPGLVVHSDRGSQYASEEDRKLLDKQKLVGSMSRKGNRWEWLPLGTTPSWNVSFST